MSKSLSDAGPDTLDGIIIEPGYRCPGCHMPEWSKHVTNCIWQTGPRDPAHPSFNPYIQAGYQILTWPLTKITEIPKIEALEVLDARVVLDNPWRPNSSASTYQIDPFYRAGDLANRWEPTLLLRIRHPIAVRAPLGSYLIYEKLEEFAARVAEWKATEHQRR